MPGSIQSIERAAAVLRLLAVSPGPVALADLARALELAKSTVHGIVSTLIGVGFVRQDALSGHYRLAEGIALAWTGLDRHELRSRSMNWADGLAARTGLEVHLAVPSGTEVELVHHVFRPDDTHQTLRTGERQPLHATAVGKVLLAVVPATPPLRSLDLHPFTSATHLRRDALAAEIAEVGRLGYAVENGEHLLGVAAIAAPVRHHGGVGVAAIAVIGRSDRVLDGSGRPRASLVAQTIEAARAVSSHLEHTS